MKKLVFGLVAMVMFCSLSYGQKINKKKACFMAIGDVIAGSQCVGLGPYGVLWGGFGGSCAAAVLWNDMFSRNSETQKLKEPLVRNNPNDFYEKYALVGKLHNDLMIKYCNGDNENNIFSNENRLSNYIKNEMLLSKEFNQSLEEKKKFIEHLTTFNDLFDKMVNKESSSVIINELNMINNANEEEDDYFKKIIEFTTEGEPKSLEEMFTFIDKEEEVVKNSSKLSEHSKDKLFYSLEILRYSYALWYENTTE